VPRILTADQKQHVINICEELHQITSDDATFLSRVLTGAKSWIYGYDLEINNNPPNVQTHGGQRR
jgi:hypothetical protein